MKDLSGNKVIKNICKDLTNNKFYHKNLAAIDTFIDGKIKAPTFASDYLSKANMWEAVRVMCNSLIRLSLRDLRNKNYIVPGILSLHDKVDMGQNLLEHFYDKYKEYL